MNLQIRDKDFNLLAEFENQAEQTATMPYLHTLRRIGDQPALESYIKKFSL